MTEEYFDIVDENNLPTDKTVLRSVAHAEGIWHRVVHIYFFRNNGNNLEFLVHLRSKLKDLNPNKWDTRFGGHLSAGQSVEDAVAREVKEEAGIEMNPEYLIKSFCDSYDGKTNREHIYVNYYNFTGDLSELSFDDGEVQEVKWISFDEIEKEMKKDPETWTGSINGLNLIKKDLLSKIAQ